MCFVGGDKSKKKNVKTEKTENKGMIDTNTDIWY